MTEPYYPVILTVILGIPIMVGGLITFAIVSNGDGVFNTIEALLLGLMLGLIVLLGIIDLIRWENWKKKYRK